MSDSYFTSAAIDGRLKQIGNMERVMSADAVMNVVYSATRAFKYSVNCNSCLRRYDATEVRWCDCLKPLRTLVCPGCESCFCTAPLAYKRKYWAAAPRSLKEDTRRFRVQLGATESVSSPRSFARQQPVVLVVDDDESICSLVACFVEQLGYRTVTSCDAQEALKICAASKIDVVITDALMPRLDGRELCLCLKSTPNGAETKVILMSSLYKALHFRSEAFQRYRVDEFLSKPIDLGALAVLLERFACTEKVAASSALDPHRS